MLEAVFSFRGRLGRLQYFVGGLALGMAIIVPLVMIGVSMFAHGGVGAKPPLGLLALFALVAVPLFLWISLSLQARRLRDIGWNPLYVIPAVFAVDLIDQTIARLPVRDQPLFQHHRLAHRPSHPRKGQRQLAFALSPLQQPRAQLSHQIHPDLGQLVQPPHIPRMPFFARIGRVGFG